MVLEYNYKLMDEKTYNKRKATALNFIHKTKFTNTELGSYLEKHFVIEDKSRTLTYTGAQTVLESLINS